MLLRSHTVDCRLDTGVEQFDDEHQQQARAEDRSLHPAVTKAQGQRQADENEQQLLAKSRLEPKGGTQSGQ